MSYPRSHLIRHLEILYYQGLIFINRYHRSAISIQGPTHQIKQQSPLALYWCVIVFVTCKMLFRFGIKLDLYRQLHRRHQALVIDFDRTRIPVIPRQVSKLYYFPPQLMFELGSVWRIGLQVRILKPGLMQLKMIIRKKRPPKTTIKKNI